jgi:hypothetical protein
VSRLSLGGWCGFLGILVTVFASTPSLKAQSESSTEQLVNAVRLINTEEVSYQHENGRFADREEMLSYLRRENRLSSSAIDLENKKPYELAITMSADGKHYQISLKPAFDVNDRKTWCTRSAFSDDTGVIFLGSALDCDGQTSK